MDECVDKTKENNLSKTNRNLTNKPDLQCEHKSRDKHLDSVVSLSPYP